MNGFLRNTFSTVIAIVLLSGCTSSPYRISSSLDKNESMSEPYTGEVTVTESALPAESYVPVGPLEVTLKKWTIIQPSPTRQQANKVLSEKAQLMGANAVIGVIYESGFGLITPGYLRASGTAVKTKN